MKKIITSLFLFTALHGAFSQNTTAYWQQKVDYKIDVNVDVKNYRYTGTQELVYTNNSSDTLKKVYFHLFNNAFKPGSEMDIRLQNIKDPDGRMVDKVKIDNKEVVQSRISKLKPDEIGYLNVANFLQDGKPVTLIDKETVLEVILPKPILPSSTTTFTLDFNGQVPVQIRRSGRNNREGIALSMAQWYPKIAEFDFEGWHADPYIAREFHGVWGNFDVKITLPKDYIIGATGYLQNKNQIGYNYQDEGVVVSIPKKQKTLTWHFKAPMVHDFTWAADKEYAHDVVKTNFGTTLHFLYKNKSEIADVWKKAQPETVKLMEYFNTIVGKYPYEQFSVIQGGDGGMEYAMCTLILGEGKLEGLVGLIAHEMGHSWFQHVLASNESKHPWMDEGFTSYIENLGVHYLAENKGERPIASSYNSYRKLVESGKEQPLSTHGDRYDVNFAYSIASYSKGELFLTQLEYLIGKENVIKTLQKYFNDFKFKHPTPNDIKRTAERITDAHLDWYLTDWTETTNTIDYGIKNVVTNTTNPNVTDITLERIGRMPMPIDLYVEYTDGTVESFYIPLKMMHYQKENPTPETHRTILNDWAWAMPTYTFTLPKAKTAIKSITIDSLGLMADIKLNNNVFKM